MVPQDFSISSFNKSLLGAVANQKLGFCQAVTLSRCKQSVIAKYAPEKVDEQYCVLGPDLTAREGRDFSAFYYGCSPKIDSFFIRNAISKLAFPSVSALEDFIRMHHAEFMLHKSQESDLLDIAKLILITIASKYGIRLRLNGKTEFLMHQKDRFPDILVLKEDAQTYKKYEGAVIELRGCPTRELLELLAPHRYRLCRDAEDVWDICDRGETIEEVYARPENIKLLVGKVFYSGVLVKPVHIEKLPDSFENDKIVSIEIFYERSTFSAVCAFDENHIGHPLLAHNRDALSRIIQRDEDCKKALCDKLAEADTDIQILDHVNAYLKESFNVNQIGVSSNVMTSDKQLFLGLRGADTIDAGCLYPGVNGNAEVYDPNVSFYNNSVYEDKPSILLGDDRCDFLGEISREAYGELRLLANKVSWECYGIVLSGTAPVEEPHLAAARRFHFNLLFENEAYETLEEIKARKMKASESFENEDFVGIHIKYYRNPLHSLVIGIGEGIKRFVSGKDFIESVFLLMLAGTSIFSATFSLDDASTVASLILALLILLTNVVQLVKYIGKWIRDLKTTRTIRIYETMSYSDLCGRISGAMGRRFHPVAYAAIKLHVENLVWDNLRKKK